MPHKLCPICNKHSIIERICAIDFEDNETWTEWYCRTCKRVIKDAELYPEALNYKQYKNKQFNEKIVAKVMLDEWMINWWNTRINSKDPTNFVVGDYKIINDKGLELLISKEEFESDFEIIEEVQD